MSLLHNPLAEMYGPNFLLLYGAVIVLTIIVCHIALQDPTNNLPIPLVPTNPDPYEIAYLQGGELQVLQLAAFELIEKGYLVVKGKNLARAATPPNLSELTSLQHDVLDWYIVEGSARDIYLRSFGDRLKPYCTYYEQKLRDEQLLSVEKNQRVIIFGSLFILSLGSYKLTAALLNGHTNVGFLILIGILGLSFLNGMLRRSSRLSDRGYSYLKRLKEAFSGLKNQIKSSNDSNAARLLVALLGAGALRHTAYDYYPGMLSPSVSRISSNNSSSGCASSCGSSGGSSCGSSGGSSCGSSCGGGCGGGCGGCGG